MKKRRIYYSQRVKAMHQNYDKLLAFVKRINDACVDDWSAAEDYYEVKKLASELLKEIEGS